MPGRRGHGLFARIGGCGVCGSSGGATKRNKPWSHQEGRELIRAQDQDVYHVGLRRALSMWRESSRSRQSDANLYSRCLSARVPADRASLPPALAPLAQEFVPLSSQHAKLLLTWMPDVRPDVQADFAGYDVFLPGTGDRGVGTGAPIGGRRVQHQSALRVHRRTIAKAMSGVMFVPLRLATNSAQPMLQSFLKVLRGMLPKRLLGAPSEWRDAAERGELFLRVISNVWLYLCYVRWGGRLFGRCLFGNARCVQRWSRPDHGT